MTERLTSEFACILIQVPACHQLNTKNSNCMSKSNSLVNWYWMFFGTGISKYLRGFAGGFDVFACVPFEG